ncbi:MAG: hypothetical protein NXI12_15050 [Alphaproteobacteria bacterium]|nr:hypothetical protein [Alphaproteobacteria bacterium]
MSGVREPEFFADLRIAVNDARVDYAFDAAPAYEIALLGEVTQAGRDIWPLGTQAQVLFDERLEGKSLVFAHDFLSIACHATAGDTQQVADLVRTAQTQQGGLLVDVDLGAKPAQDDPNRWYVTDVGVMLPNILI